MRPYPLPPFVLIVLLAATTLAQAQTQTQAVPVWPPTGGWQSPLGTAHPLAGTVYDVKAKALITPAQALEALASARYVLAGERHDNPDHHRVQATVLQALIAAGRRPAVVFEMIDEDQAPALAAYLTGTGPGTTPDPAGLGPAVAWEERGWPAWSMYQPIAAVALKAGLPLVPGLLGRDALRAVAMTGWEALPAARRAALKPEGALPEAVAAVQRKAVIEGHCGMLPESAAGPMVRVQAAKDSTMAEAMLRAGETTDGAILIAGNGHVRKDVGVPFQIDRLGASGGVLTVAAMEVQADETDPGAYGAMFGTEAPPFDYVFFTAATDHGDPCEVFRDQLKRAGDRMKARETKSEE